ncbi:shikimate dehydrogenase [Agrobacterium sp. T29]|uniref:shikimate dehydrogenase family protein n=1 Tax=Agrobacterium sp. T29 TaxID=2580515 RepID=UPI00115D2598|nr:shikimate dehydrogenase [Agrobacterium sp. T29]
MNITGKTAMLLMLADPVDHIRGTVLINESFDALGLDAAIVPIHLRPDDLAACLTGIRLMRNVAGLGITIPHKIAVLPLLDEIEPVARRIGAVNFVRRHADGTLSGTNTDGAGFVAGLLANGFSIAGKRAMVVGTGGVGRAIAFALADAGIAQLRLANRDRPKAEALAAEIADAVPGCILSLEDPQTADAAGGLDLLVNATSLGTAPNDRLPIRLDGLSGGTTVAEVVVNPSITPLLAIASERGCTFIPGAEMLKPQPRLVAEFFGLIHE